MPRGASRPRTDLEARFGFGFATIRVAAHSRPSRSLLVCRADVFAPAPAAVPPKFLRQRALDARQRARHLAARKAMRWLGSASAVAGQCQLPGRPLLLLLLLLPLLLLPLLPLLLLKDHITASVLAAEKAARSARGQCLLTEPDQIVTSLLLTHTSCRHWTGHKGGREPDLARRV